MSQAREGLPDEQDAKRCAEQCSSRHIPQPDSPSESSDAENVDHLDELGKIPTYFDTIRPEKPPTGSEAYTRFDLTNSLWDLISLCWAANPASRPDVSGILQHAALSSDL